MRGLCRARILVYLACGFALLTSAFGGLNAGGDSTCIESPLACESKATTSLATANVNDISARLGVDAWHSAGLLGHGVKVAILDSGFHDYRSFLGHALPHIVAAQSFRRDANLQASESQHGILCGEVVHTLAPQASLLFANWEPDRPESFLRAVLWAKQQGAKVLVCSLIMPAWSDGEGGGDIHAALAKVIGRGTAGNDMLFFASAGNLAERHWSGRLRPDVEGFHQWFGANRDNPVIPWGNDRVSVELYGQGCQDLEVQVRETATSKQIGRCRAGKADSPCGCPCASVRFLPQPGSEYQVRVRSNAGMKNPSQPFHLVILGGGLLFTTANGSIPFPADGANVHAVGAVDDSNQRLSYSSCGPNSRLLKPDLVAPVPFPSSWRAQPFSGTSAAAPQAAALAALFWSRHPNWNAAQVSQALKQTSRDLGPMGHDWETGHGLLRLPPTHMAPVR